MLVNLKHLTWINRNTISAYIPLGLGYKMLVRARKDECAPWAPVLNDAGQKNLLWVICNIRTQAVNYVTIVAISITNHIIVLHVSSQELEDTIEWRMEQVASKSSKLFSVFMLAICCQKLWANGKVSKCQILWGMDKKANSPTPLRWAQRTLLWINPFER